MAPFDDTASSKIIEVLTSIDTKLEGLDRRLQTLEKSWQSTAGAAGHASTPERSDVHWTKHKAFDVRYRIAEGRLEAQEIIVKRSDLLELLLRISNPCLNRNFDPQIPSTERRGFKYPFTELLNYGDILRFVLEKGRELDKELRPLFFPPSLPFDLAGLQAEIEELWDFCDLYAPPSFHVRNGNVSRGVISFDDLPSLLSPGVLLVGSGKDGSIQVVEVSSCDLVSAPPASDRVEVEAWHFRWDGGWFSRESKHFSVDRYRGTREIISLPFHPIITFDSSKSLAELQRLSFQAETMLAKMRNELNFEPWKYPICNWSRFELSHSNATRRILETVVVDPKLFHAEADSSERRAFSCYCMPCLTSLGFRELLLNARYLLLAPGTVDGYHFESKMWKTLSIGNLQPYDHDQDWEAETLEDLNMEEAVITSLRDDFLRYFQSREKILKAAGKLEDKSMFDQRLVFQFHGPRAVGKTILATHLAASVQRPLLVLRPADLGMEFAAFGKTLSFFDRVSVRWGVILLIAEADHTLQAGSPLILALTDILPRAEGPMIFVTTSLAHLDHNLVPFIRHIPFHPGSKEFLKRVFYAYLDRLAPHSVESRDEIMRWVDAATSSLSLTGGIIRDICRGAVERADAEGHALVLDDIIQAYTARTGRPNEWDFTTDSAVSGYSQREGLSPAPDVAEVLRKVFGTACRIPDDGRLALTFTESFASTITWKLPSDGIHFLGNLIERIEKAGTFRIIDWGWPSGLWSPVEGCAYWPHHSITANSPPPGDPELQWRQKGFTLGLRHLINSDAHGAARYGMPWRRLLLIQGLAEVDYRQLFNVFSIFNAGGPGERSAMEVSRVLPFLGTPREPGWGHQPLTRDSLLSATLSHLSGVTLRPPRPEAPLATPAELDRAAPTRSPPKSGFHIVFFEMKVTPVPLDQPVKFHFYGQRNLSLRKSCFTLLHVPPDREKTSSHLYDPIHWTVICLTPLEFWTSPSTYAICHAPSFRAHSAHLIAKALVVVVARWRSILLAVEDLIDSDQVLQHQDRLRDVLFDDDTFSRSKGYFWAINFIHESIKLLDNAVEQWAAYQRFSVAPYRVDSRTGREEYWFERSQEVLAKAEQEAKEACEDLKVIRQEFVDKLERITVLRDGLFNASAVMESRASTQLGENVKLLTFVSIFFLPLGLCVAIWSINESYSRADLAIVTVVSAAATYCVTLNLDNLVRGLRGLYAPRRRALIEQMERDAAWRDVGGRFRAFQRSEKAQERPSEWWILAFLLRRAVQGVGGLLGKLCR